MVGILSLSITRKNRYYPPCPIYIFAGLGKNAQCDPNGNGIELQFIEHISPITWDNVILYGEYVLDEKMVKL